jgi:molybdopterin molybdotransferase
MHGFEHRHTVQAALAWLDAQLRVLDSEYIPLHATSARASAAGRVLAAPMVSNVDVPGFDRATMDGYALHADAIEGASSYNPITLRVVGDAMPGVPFDRPVAADEAVRIMTGAPMPAGSDAVLPAEWVDAAPAARDRIVALSSVSKGRNIGQQGEDITRGTTVLDGGRTLRPQDLGVLSSIGMKEVPVVRRPRVRLVITGNELLPAGSAPRGFQITDANGPMLTALAQRDGALVDFPGLVPDHAEAILASLHADADIVIVSGGSSVGIEDLAPGLVATHGELAVHGIAMRPSSPTGLGRVGHRLVFLLPGNPVSSLCAYDFFAGRAIRALGGRSREWPYRRVRGTLTRKIASPVGRLDYARVTVADGRVEPVSVAGASRLSSTTRADGFVVVADDSEGFAAGSEIEVWLYA